MRINYKVVSDASFASRHSVDIWWSKPQDVSPVVPSSDVEVIADPQQFTLSMTGVATPDAKQSEAYAATSAIFYIFSGNSREEKVGLRLPPVWRDLFSELVEARKEHLDSQDRTVLRELRSLVRRRRDQELEDGVIIQGAFRGRGAAKSTQDSSENGSQDRSVSHGVGNDANKQLWENKSKSRKYQMMLVSQALCETVSKYIRTSSYF